MTSTPLGTSSPCWDPQWKRPKIGLKKPKWTVLTQIVNFLLMLRSWVTMTFFRSQWGAYNLHLPLPMSLQNDPKGTVLRHFYMSNSPFLKFPGLPAIFHVLIRGENVIACE